MEIPLDAIGTIFIFLIGLPAILLQTLAPEIRRTVMQWRVQLVGFTMAPIVVSGAVFAVGIWLHWHKVGSMDPDPNGEQTFGVNMLWVNIITILVVIAGASTIVLTERWRRATVIGRLSKSAARTVPTLGRPHEQDLINLIQLGRQSHPGEDKRLVLEALHDLATAVHRSGKYDGAQLDNLVAGIDEIVVSGTEVDSPRNFQFSADLLMHMILKARDCEHSDDLKHAIQMTSIVAQASLANDHLDVQARFVEALAAVSEAHPESNVDRRQGFATWDLGKSGTLRDRQSGRGLGSRSRCHGMSVQARHHRAKPGTGRRRARI